MNTLVIDIETTGLDPETDKIVCIGYKYNNEEFKCLFEKVPNEVINLMESSQILKIGHNLSFDCKFLRKNGINVCGPYFDTMIACRHSNPFRDSLKLKDILQQEFNIKPVLLKDLLWKEIEIEKTNKKGKIRKIKKKVKISVSELNKEILFNYNKQDVEGTYQLFLKYKDISDWTKYIEFPLIDVSIYMEKQGLYLDQRRLNLLLESFLIDRKDIEQEFDGINLRSPVQLREEFIKRGIDTGILTPKKDMSTGVIALKQSREKSPIINNLLKHRTLNKFITSYLLPFKNKIILNGNFNQVGTITGRYSSSNPNMQNIPARTKEGQELRKCIIPRPGYKFIISDLSQIEPRLYAYYSNDPKLIKIFSNNEDFHSQVTKAIYNRENFTKEERFVGKTVGLATLYLAGVEKLKETLIKYDVNLSIEEVTKIRNSIRNNFPSSIKWSYNFNDLTYKRGYLTTLGGRIINIKDQKLNPTNYLIQGSCADIMKIILLNLYDNGFRILSTIHDEVIIEELNEKIEELLSKVKWIFENSVILKNIPILAECRVAESWAK